MNEQTMSVVEIPYHLQQNLINIADDFKIKSQSKRPLLPEIHTKDAMEIRELRKFVAKLRKKPISKISEEDKESLYERTHAAWRNCELTSLEKREKERSAIVIGKSLKMLRAFDDYDIKQVKKN